MFLSCVHHIILRPASRVGGLTEPPPPHGMIDASVRSSHTLATHEFLLGEPSGMSITLVKHTSCLILVSSTLSTGIHRSLE